MQKKKRRFTGKRWALLLGIACFLAIAGCNAGQTDNQTESELNSKNEEPTATPKPTATQLRHCCRRRKPRPGLRR